MKTVRRGSGDRHSASPCLAMQASGVPLSALRGHTGRHGDGCHGCTAAERRAAMTDPADQALATAVMPGPASASAYVRYSSVMLLLTSW